MFWQRIRSLWARHDQQLADRELRRGLAEEGLGVPHTGGALFDEPFQPTESVPRDDLPDTLPDEG